MILYTVKKGDSLYKIATTYNSSVQEIVSANGLNVTTPLIVGQGLVIPQVNQIYVVKKGDSLYSISKMYKTTINNILEQNPYINKPYTLYPGQQIFIRNDLDSKPPLSVNGYVFANTNKDFYINNSPDITFLSFFSYGFNNDGDLISPDDQDILKRVKDKDISMIMTVTNTNENGSFSTSLASSLLNDKNKAQKIIKQIHQILENKGYYGVNVDFEYVSPKDKDAYINFLNNLRQELDYDYELSVALAPKYSNSQEGLLYEAHDYKAIGEIVDRIVIMTYEWGYTYGPAMAVAPLDEVEKVINYAITEIDPLKINLGIPTYGYDFVVPYKKGNKARSLSYEGALETARKKNVSIHFDEKTQTPYFTYYEIDNKHEVHYEDARSIGAKINLALAYGLGGISFWTLRSNFTPMWTVINETIDVIKH